MSDVITLISSCLLGKVSQTERQGYLFRPRLTFTIMLSPKEWIFILLLVTLTLGENSIFLDVVDYSPSRVSLSCGSNSLDNMTGVFFSVMKGKYECMYRTNKDCKTYFENNCDITCPKPDKPNIMTFDVELTGSCDEVIKIGCSIGSTDMHDVLDLEKSITLASHSQPPVISINKGQPVEVSCEEVEVSCTIANNCNQTEIYISGDEPLKPVSLTHKEEKGSRYTTTAISTAIFNNAGNYTIYCYQNEKDDQYSRSSTFTVYSSENNTQSQVFCKCSGVISCDSQYGYIPAYLIPVTFGCTLLLVVLVFFSYCLKKRCETRPEERFYSEYELEGLHLLNREQGPIDRKKPEILELIIDSTCGIWVDADGESGESISEYITRKTRKTVERAKIEEISFLQEGPNYMEYFALISSDSLRNKEFMAYFTSVVLRVLILNHKSTFVLVLLERDSFATPANLPDESLDNDLRGLPRVNAYYELDEFCLRQILDKLIGPPLDTKDFRGLYYTGVGLAWSYFCGYLALILPEMTQRIEKSESQKKHGRRMNPRFVIIIPQSGRTPAKLNEIDRRFSFIGQLDDGIKRSRAGHPERPYKNFVHQIKRRDDDLYYFCGEYATPVSTLDKLCVHGKLNEVEMKEQLQLFAQTLKSILQSHPNCGENVVVFTFKEVSTMVDKLCNLITTPNQPFPIRSNPVMPVTRVAEGLAQSYYYGYLTTIGPSMTERIRRSKPYSQKRMPTKFFILLPYSCYCYPTLEGADVKNIRKDGDLEPLVIDIAANKCSFDTSIHEISENYLACVEYCTPVLVMYEMAKEENEVGLSQVQQAAELRVLYEILYDLIHGPSAPEYCCNFELVYYDDNQRPLSEILVEKIKESLGEAIYENAKSTSPV